MITTIVYTLGFRNNLSRYFSPVRPEPAKEVLPILEPKPYEPKFIVTDLYLDYKTPKAEIPPINYTKPERNLRLRPDSSIEIQKAIDRNNLELQKQKSILENEQQVINKAKKSQESLNQTIQKQDLRQQDKSICENQRLELIQCLKTKSNCYTFNENWKACLDNNSIQLP